MGLADFLSGNSPGSQGLMALSQALLAAGQPSRIPVSNAQAFGGAINAALPAYNSALARQKVGQALQGNDLNAAMNTMLTSGDPTMQNTALQGKMSMLQPDNMIKMMVLKQMMKNGQLGDLASNPPGASPDSAAPDSTTASPPLNNPGNMRPVGATTGFQKFATPEAGMQAMRNDLLLKLSGKSDAMGGKPPTLANIISTWSPPNENNTPRLIQNAALRTGLDPNKTLGPQDVDTVMKAIVQQEQGGTGGASTQQAQISDSGAPALPKDLQQKLNYADAISMFNPQWADSLRKGVESDLRYKKALADIDAGKAGDSKHEENVAEAEKGLAATKSSIENTKAMLMKLRGLSGSMINGGPNMLQDFGLGLSKSKGHKWESATNEFNTLNKQIFTNGLVGSIPQGSRLDIPIVNALKAAKEVDPYSSDTARKAVIDNHIHTLDLALENAQKNYGLLKNRQTGPLQEQPSGAQQPGNGIAQEDILAEMQRRGLK